MGMYWPLQNPRVGVGGGGKGTGQRPEEGLCSHQGRETGRGRPAWSLPQQS